MKKNLIVKYCLITALIASSIIPFSGYVVILMFLLYIGFKNGLKDILSLINKERRILFIFIYIVFSILNSNYKIDSLIGGLGAALTICIYIIIRNYRLSINDTRDIFKFFIISNIIISGYGIIQFYFIENSNFSSSWVDSTVYNISMRAYSSLLNPNILAGYLVFCICIQLTSLEKLESRRLNVFSILISSFCLTLTYSRGAWISLFIVALLIYIYRKKIVYIIYLSLFFISLSLINGNSGFERLSISRSLQDNSLLYRLEIYKASIKIIEEHFLFGTGLNTMKHYIDYYSDKISAPVFHAHNLLLNIIGETGFVGLIIFGIILVTLLKNLYYIYILEDDFYTDIAISGFLGFMSIFIHGFIDAVIIAPQFLFFVVYIYSFISNIKDTKTSFNKSSGSCSSSKKNSGGEVYGTRDTRYKKGYLRA